MARKRRCRQNGPREKAVLIRVDDDEKRMIQDAARRRGQTVSLTVIEAVKLLEGSLYVEEEEHDSPTVQALREIEYQLRRIGRNVNQIAHNANREMNATIEDEASASYAVRQCRELIDHLDAVIGMSTSRCTASNFFSATLLNWLLNFTISLDMTPYWYKVYLFTKFAPLLY